MKRKEMIINQLQNIIKKCDNREFYKLLLDFQGVDLMYGYSVAILSAFEENKVDTRNDRVMLSLMRSGELEKMFDDWLREEI